MKELLDEGILDLSAANGTEIPYEGWIGIEFSLPENKDSELLVPILVSPDPLVKPIIGFNVIEEIAQTNVSTDRTLTSKFVLSLGSALDVGHKKARAVYSVLKKQKGDSESQIARLGRQHVIIPKHKMVNVVCGKLNKYIKYTMACWTTGKATVNSYPMKINQPSQTTEQDCTWLDICCRHCTKC